ncbi:alpha/beta hydrolase [Longispora fulva]|uniref:Pimeloyl-ACP methyl ester carboxylesterase n=1 Tax=Longispora fulva TaxID=619741 RepID=A0A8J7KFV2_9ACTN|nr:alpha/beta hydrolase [Longispora fulva]MBG6136650.1 pimeloyl-ACP methyl ester carboxylesterase [Longispora fulva]GIG59819.1 alpha/beta hydrolase [Longispora fulva]
MSMQTVVSRDGTEIAYDRSGSGPAVIMMAAGPTDHWALAGIAELLAQNFTVFNYDRRGRGASGDTAPYAPEREYEDLQALITAAGGNASVFGSSGGGILALQAAGWGVDIGRLAIWEAPFILEGSRPPVRADYRQNLEKLLAADRRGDMIESFMTDAVGMPAEFVTPMRDLPFWPNMERIAHTLVYDAIIIGDWSLPGGLPEITVPTLVIEGGTTPWLTQSAEALTRALPQARKTVLPGQTHDVEAAVIAPVLAEFFG